MAGIEIENSTRADVYDNLATDNSGGILVFTMPDLPKKDGRHCRVYNNRVLANNHDNFAPKGNIVADRPARHRHHDHGQRPGRGLRQHDRAEPDRGPLDRQLPDHRQADQRPEVRPVLRVDPRPRQPIRIQRRQAGRALGELLAKALGTPLPDILYDGVVDPKKLVDGKLPDALAIRIHDNGKAGFANFDAPA